MSKLALFGGEKAVKGNYDDIAVIPVVRERAYKTVEEIMRKNEISFSPVVTDFERRYADFIGVKHGLTTVNGTTAIMTSLFACGVGPGDEVIVPSYTFWATVGPVVAVNAVPVFCDVDLDTHMLTAELIEKQITPRTKAILIVHVWGTPADMDSIMALAKKYNLKVVEDCSHAHGAKYKGKRIGSFGDCAAFSFQGSKTMAAGEAGIFLTDNDEYFARGCALGHYERLNKLPDESEYKKYSLTGFGYKHRAHPLAIAIADAALDDLEETNAVRNKYGKYLEELTADLDYLIPQVQPEGAERLYAYHFARYVPEKLKGLNINTLLKALAAEGVVCGSCGYGRLHKAPLYTEEDSMIRKGCPFNCPHHGSEPYRPNTDLPNTELLATNSFMMAPRFEKDTPECKEYVEQFALAYHKIAENVDELVKYEEENNLRNVVIENDGRSICIYK
ncbi:MAG: aminotransferase class I/II-fold pyridoxal phosphate-dependent enzyme [Clostridia bacterium]|nr:aminotransferase class I/II-fold pyridoxal phosphate-dependent enzyme [Clostridia bacterium]